MELSRARMPLPNGAAESQIQKGTRSSLLVSAPNGIETLELATAFAELGLTMVWAKNTAEAEALVHLPRFALVGASKRRELSLVRKLTVAPNDVIVVAIIGPDDCDGPAYEAGASVVLRKPLSIPGACAVLRRLRDADARMRAASEAKSRDFAHALAGSAATLAWSLAGEIGPAIAALRAAVPADRGESAGGDAGDAGDAGDDNNAAERRANAALRRLEDVQARLAELAGGPPLSVAELDLKRAADRAALRARRSMARWAAQKQAGSLSGPAVLDSPFSAPRAESDDDIAFHGRPAIDVVADEAVLGLANAARLDQVLGALFESVMRIVGSEGGPGILVRVYATSTEARISIRDHGPGLSLALRGALAAGRGLGAQPTTARASHPQSGLGLAIAVARQAIVAMGGALSFTDAGPSGACIRVRLRTADRAE